ncbi:hypothetical protein ACWEOE_00250 [Amycolatopsis sp. NPDC004368]
MTYGTNDGSTIDHSNDNKNDHPTFHSPGDQSPTGVNGKWIPDNGQVTTPPPVPGKDGAAGGKGDTVVNTEAMRTFAKNMQTLADGPLKDLPNQLDSIVLKPGVFATAQTKIVTQITGTGGARDTVRATIQDLVTSLHDLSEAVNKASKEYDEQDNANNMTADKYNEYFSAVGTEINNAGSKKS